LAFSWQAPGLFLAAFFALLRTGRRRRFRIDGHIRIRIFRGRNNGPGVPRGPGVHLNPRIDPGLRHPGRLLAGHAGLCPESFSEAEPQHGESHHDNVLHSLKCYPRRLKNCTARSCRSASVSVLKVPRLRRLPVFGFFFLEYSLYSPDSSFRIISSPPDSRGYVTRHGNAPVWKSLGPSHELLRAD